MSRSKRNKKLPMVFRMEFIHVTRTSFKCKRVFQVLAEQDVGNWAFEPIITHIQDPVALCTKRQFRSLRRNGP